MTEVEEIVLAIGHTRLAGLLGVGGTAIWNAKSKGSFPAHWFVVIRAECEKIDLACPESLFNFKQVKQDADAPEKRATA